MTNNADPDQLASQKPTDLDLHCLLKLGMSCLVREGLMLFLVDCLQLSHTYVVCKCQNFLKVVVHVIINDQLNQTVR